MATFVPPATLRLGWPDADDDGRIDGVGTLFEMLTPTR
jgi:hypothetical protein